MPKGREHRVPLLLLHATTALHHNCAHLLLVHYYFYSTQMCA